MVKIAYCAGHGSFGVTPGKRTPAGEHEWEFNNKLVLAFEAEMKNYENVQLLRTDDATGKTDVPLNTRTKKSNTWGADIYISFHHNANTAKWGNWTGVETWYYTGSTSSKNLASAVHPALVQGYNLKDRGLKPANNLAVLRDTKCPAILLEGGFMDSKIDILKLRDNKVLNQTGRLIGQKLAVYLKLKKKPAPAPITVAPVAPTPVAPIPNTTSAHIVQKGETLWAIANKYKLTVNELKALNGLKKDLINVGDKLIVEKQKKIKVDKIKNFTFIYSKPSSIVANQLGEAKKDSVFECVAVSGEYYQVKYDNKIGYIAKKYCSLI